MFASLPRLHATEILEVHANSTYYESIQYHYWHPPSVL